MSKNPLARLPELGQSVWYDNIHRAMIHSGELAQLMNQDGLRGITSNPSIFEKAITAGEHYDNSLAELVKANPKASARDHFFALAIQDIQAAADVLRPVYEQTGARDGYVSLEVSPDLANDTQGSIAEARALFARLERPNVMIKIPATREGIPVIEQLTNDGINVNVTLLFAVDRYIDAAQAYLRGLAARHGRGEPIARIASVASFFVSRVDNALDPLLQKAGKRDLAGRCAIANAKLAYANYQRLYNSQEFAPLKAAGAQTQRLLWASTGVKNPDYSDVLYVDNLIGPDTVNTLPPATYQAFKDHGQARQTLGDGVDRAAEMLATLPSLGMDLAAITAQLEAEGVAAFVKSFDNLLGAIDKKVTAIKHRASSAA